VRKPYKGTELEYILLLEDDEYNKGALFDYVEDRRTLFEFNFQSTDMFICNN